MSVSDQCIYLLVFFLCVCVSDYVQLTVSYLTSLDSKSNVRRLLYHFVGTRPWAMQLPRVSPGKYSGVKHHLITNFKRLAISFPVIQLFLSNLMQFHHILDISISFLQYPALFSHIFTNPSVIRTCPIPHNTLTGILALRPNTDQKEGGLSKNQLDTGIRNCMPCR